MAKAQATAGATTAVTTATMKKRKLGDFKSVTDIKKMRLEKVSSIAKNVIIDLLSKELSYDVTDAEWERLVQLTREHPSYSKLFNFPADQPGWKTPKSKSKPTTLKIIALDCEMCTTQSLQDMSTKSALCRVSAVDGEDMVRSVAADLIVHQPEDGFRMLDPKTRIHGITLDMINQSKISMEKAQKHVLKYISSDTIVVGHSVHGDLSALRLNHTRVIDTALIFRRCVGDPKRNTPGLKDLTKFLLKFEMPDGHDSSIDAQASMLAAKYAVRNPCGAIIPASADLHGPTPAAAAAFVAGEAATQAIAAGPVVVTAAPVASSCRVLLHRIPKGVVPSDIENFFTQQTKIVPTLVESIKWPPAKKHGSAHVTFLTKKHAALAFESALWSNEKAAADGKVKHDSAGRPEKVVAVVNQKGVKFDKIRLVLI
ncbi:TPA: hypothetical protein N0F65_008106 [Lagenidium giganteum]|uniref:Exonuclease domain-containing protein n=1 Tax=Lagenidium giganteum TaxID=4803 RepID=A0AAV2Z3A9_9STRA|nr:TPA: hypothetical protein N0F65_008106 [Lagenidium giganteum]